MTTGWRHSSWGGEISLEYGKAIRGYHNAEAPFRVFGSNGPIGWTDTALTDGPGIILGRKGAYRGVHFSHDPFSVIDTAYFVKPKVDADMRWLYYAIIYHKLGEIDDGSPIPSTTRAAVYVQDLEVPPVPEQRAIAQILGALDDKIDLNRRMNETLEAMARALFKDWFVDFGPTRAKAEGRDPYLAPELWNLFPDALDDERKPVGWERKPLDEVADFLNGLALQKFPASDPEDSLSVIKIAELRGGVTAKSNRASYELPEKYIVTDGDFLFSWSGSLMAKFWTGGEGALNQHLFKVTSDRYPAWFFSQWVYHHLKEFQAIAASKATTMGHIQRWHLKEAMATCPPDDVLSILGQMVGPLVKHAIKNELETRKLAQTRDLLLPKLMSGEIRLRNVEKAMEAVVEEGNEGAII
ncbi:MAG: restriction endonuclease subunit S [Alphaproteobacteria bacterium]|nr:restriction endonuclease subunit S [Alphaproteobacteria bacterium]